MKIYNLFIVSLSGLCLLSCSDGLLKDFSGVDISVETNDAVTLENNIVTVERGTSVKFNISGEPDNITFYSGETGHNYDYRNRTTIDVGQINSSIMTFDIEPQYSTNAAYVDLFNMYISESFPGLYKDDFEEDCNQLAGFTEWTDWVSQDQLPQNSSTTTHHEIDMMPYMGSNVTLAIHYHPSSDANVQPKLNFRNFKITNTLANGTTVELTAGNMGFTPVNVWSSDLSVIQIKDDDLKKNNGYYDDSGNLIESALWYGTVSNNIWGMWNLESASAGYFYVHSTDAGKGIRESWLVSDYLVINECTPDEGIVIKNISNRLETYEYTYEEVGTYKATFVLNNVNYKNEESKIITMVINVK